ncbi:FtsQ-type POTRA domain-containing protein [Corallococcus sp. ZKHCc1 1396]|uniref:Cell division protein FtsQ n=1 Tax=Corallococcus soli TaxID=2710757 RepID=A0ABR9PQ45_9BACT|nr:MULTISPECIES: FtsQ-type POTRA domain-containing protein [Corallococcus]MBE4750009.1 FtsQ-type POTRA domain-containing protein [Corallococcus soli]MCY1035794.1 FtsQ-type POTRA domain-containing protein [Corallococcus sp. BB11-1]
MAFGKNKKRRHLDTASRNTAVKGAVRSHGPRVAKALGLTVATAALVWGGIELRAWARVSPHFALESVTFTGLERASRPELLKLSGLAAGQNLWSLEPAALAKAMGQHPWVRTVEVTRRFPRGVSVEVLEHAPAALAVLGDLYVLDEEGEPFKRVTPGDGLDLPLVTGLERDAYVADADAVRARFREALDVTRAYARLLPGRSERLSEVRLENSGLALVTATGQEVRLGAGDTEVKLQRLARVRRELSTRGLAAAIIRLDNRARPGWVAVRLSSGSDSERSGGSTQ